MFVRALRAFGWIDQAHINESFFGSIHRWGGGGRVSEFLLAYSIPTFLRTDESMTTEITIFSPQAGEHSKRMVIVGLNKLCSLWKAIVCLCFGSRQTWRNEYITGVSSRVLIAKCSTITRSQNKPCILAKTVHPKEERKGTRKKKEKNNSSSPLDPKRFQTARWWPNRSTASASRFFGTERSSLPPWYRRD